MSVESKMQIFDSAFLLTSQYFQAGCDLLASLNTYDPREILSIGALTRGRSIQKPPGPKWLVFGQIWVL